MKENTVDGVFALWYGKGPGVDRAGDPLKHGNYAGTNAQGGVLAVFGDDHPGKSSTIAHHSEQAMAAHGMPILYPSNVNEFVEYGLLGYALSRYSGCWVGFKVVNETIEQTATVDIDLDALHFERPPTGDLPPEGIHWRGSFAPMVDEMILKRTKLPLARKFARANGIDRLAFGPAQARFGLVTAGKAYQDTMQALNTLGLDAARAQALGIAVYKVGMIWPLEPEGITAFAAGKQELMFVEEKNPFVESQSAALLYNLPARPRITGKSDETGLPLLPSDALLEPIEVALAIAQRLQANGIWDEALAERVSATRSYRGALLAVVSPGAKRLPFYCSGCPHNTSTNFPQGSVAISGIGCHGMAVWAKPGTLLGTQMGGEGVNWVGLHRFTKTKHVFQNLGDGTYFHSGLLAIRQAIASGANITYKILFNDAVAMTGGQKHEGGLTVDMIARQVAAEGVRKIALVTDEPYKYPSGMHWPSNMTIRHREDLDEVQRDLAAIDGVTVLLYDQTCAAEKRRRRKRGTFPDPDKRVIINELVCEGCGDCGVKSNCVSVQPLETEFGRKRTIDQSSCNKDFSCVNGFCPSFVTVHGATPRKAKPRDMRSADALPVPPEPKLPEIGAQPFSILVSGVGGTGVVTISAILGMAAHLEGKGVGVIDMAGLAQKGGAVYCHVKIGRRPEDVHAIRVAAGEADLALGCDLVVAGTKKVLSAINRGETGVFVNTAEVYPGEITRMADFSLPGERVKRAIQEAAGDNCGFVDASGAATALLGNSIGGNMFMLGFAWQRGFVPLSEASILRAIQLNGEAVAMNTTAFAWGRRAAADPKAFDALLAPLRKPTEARELSTSLDEVVARREKFLTAYQNAAYAARYRSIVDRARAAEQRAAPGKEDFAQAVARYLFKLMAVKDEYEVARLYTDGSFRKQLDAAFENVGKLEFHLAPPLLGRKDAQGNPLKTTFGPWMTPVYHLLASLKFLRGSALDVFGKTAERKMERRLIEDYEATLQELEAGLGPQTHALAVQIASVPEKIRGFGHVKDSHLQKAKAEEAKLLGQFRDALNPVKVAAE